ncbi:MAG: YoaK family protein [Butyricicoccus sp.]|nr:YoaK family protein [Butyricicoccus sp.]
MHEPTQMSESVRLGAVLAITGGFFDAYTYLCRGGVFANAQTGNIVLLGVNLANAEWMRALHYVLPILAFALGVAAAEWVKLNFKTRPIGVHWRQIVILAEMALVALVAFLPQSANMAANTLVSFICALQVESFRKMRGSAFATTMCTGNLRSATEQLVRWRTDGDAEARRKSGRYAVIILYFIAGAALGVGCVQLWHDRAVLVCCALHALVFGLMFREKID